MDSEETLGGCFRVLLLAFDRFRSTCCRIANMYVLLQLGIDGARVVLELVRERDHSKA